MNLEQGDQIPIEDVEIPSEEPENQGAPAGQNFEEIQQIDLDIDNIANQLGHNLLEVMRLRKKLDAAMKVIARLEYQLKR